MCGYKHRVENGFNATGFLSLFTAENPNLKSKIDIQIQSSPILLMISILIINRLTFKMSSCPHLTY